MASLRRRESAIRARAALRLATVCAWLLVCAAAHAAPHTIDVAGAKVTVWEEPSDVPQPVLVFSHGFHGCATQSTFLMDAFAEAGFIVFAANHRDATCNGGPASWFDRPDAPFRRPESWTDASHRDRANDIAALIAALRADERFKGRADFERLGLVGHSLGGYTVLGLAGAWPSWRIEGVKAVLALSPYTQPFLSRGTLGALGAPVMYQGGTWDFGITPSIAKPEGAYAQSAAPKYFVEFDSAGHMAWTDLPDWNHAAITAYSIAFVNRYVKGEGEDPLLTHAGKGVADLRFDAGRTVR